MQEVIWVWSILVAVNIVMHTWDNCICLTFIHNTADNMNQMMKKPKWLIILIWNLCSVSQVLSYTHGSQPCHVRPRILGSVAWSIKQAICSSTLEHRSPTWALLLCFLSPIRIFSSAVYSGVCSCPFFKSVLKKMVHSSASSPIWSHIHNKFLLEV